MDSSPHRDAPKEPATPRDPPRESSDDESVADQELEEARAAALKATEYFQALERRSQEKASPPVPAPTPAAAAPPEHGTPRQKHRAPSSMPEVPRGPTPPPPASPAPAAKAPQPAPMPAPAQTEPKSRHQEQPSPAPSPLKKRIPAQTEEEERYQDEEPEFSYYDLRGTSFTRATKTKDKVLKWKKIPNQVRNNSTAIANIRKDVGVCHLRRNRRDASPLLSLRALC